MHIYCQICNRQFNKYASLSLHIRAHSYSVQQYYDEFIRKEGEETCERCGKPCLLRDMNKGYQRFCSGSCRSKVIGKERASKPSQSRRLSLEETEVYTSEYQARCLSEALGLRHYWTEEMSKRTVLASAKIKAAVSGRDHHWYGSDQSGSNNPMWGRKHSEETKRLLSLRAKERAR